MRQLKQLLPNRLKDSLKVLIGKASAVEEPARPSPTGLSCPVCDARDIQMQPLPFHYFRELDRYQFVHSIFMSETMNLEHYLCSSCLASDRDRLYALYFKRVLAERSSQLTVLDIAPAAALTRFLRAQRELRIRTADLYMENVDDKVDITNMHQYADGQFDAFICSHVLEHIPNDLVAMRELFRVLKVGGWGIAMVPINLALTAILEDPSITDEPGRWKFFGQNDHVRMYSKQGFIERLSSVGFRVETLGQKDFGEDAFKRYAIHPRSVLYIVRK
jgi:SAM-dependent methyltransferase